MSIVTLDEAKVQLNIAASYTDDDAEIQGYVDGITRVIENYKHEVIEQRTISERVLLERRSKFRLCWQLPVISLTSLTALDGSQTWDVSPAAVDLDPNTGIVIMLSGDRPVGWCRVVYEAGYAPADVPVNYKRGALVVLQHVWETQRGVGMVAAGVVGPEEAGTRDPWLAFTLPRRALEWLGQPNVPVA